MRPLSDRSIAILKSLPSNKPIALQSLTKQGYLVRKWTCDGRVYDSVHQVPNSANLAVIKPIYYLTKRGKDAVR